MQLEHNVLGMLSRSTGVQKAHDLAQDLLKRRGGAATGALRAECFALLGFIHLLWGQLADAGDFAARTLTQDPSHPHAHTVAGILLCKRGELAAGIAELEAAIRTDPAAYLALLRRAEACEALGDDTRALQAWADVAQTSGQAPALPAWMRVAANGAQERLRQRLPAN